MATRKKKTTKKSKPAFTADGIAKANQRLRGSGRTVAAIDSGTIGDSIERRIDDYVSVLGDDVLTSSGYNRDGVKDAASCKRILKRLATDDNTHHNIIAQCKVAAIHYGIIRVIVHLLADFATEGMSIVHDQVSVQNFYDVWMKKVQLKERINRFLVDYFESATVAIHKTRAQLRNDQATRMKRSSGKDVRNIDDHTLYLESNEKLKKGKIIEPQVVIDKNIDHLGGLDSGIRKKIEDGRVDCIVSGYGQKNDRIIPWKYVSLPVLQMETRNKGLSNNGQWVFALTKEDTESVKNFLTYVYNKKKNIIKVNLPKNFDIREYTGAKKGSYTSEIILSDDNVSVIQDKKPDDWSWAIPFVYPALKHLKFKDYLRQMEIKFCKSVINSVTLWALGDPANGIYPEDEHFERLADMLEQPGQAMNIVWPAPIVANVIEPKINNILDPRKHTAVDKDILASLGTSDLLVGGEGSNFSNAFIHVAALLKRLEVARDKFTNWLYGELYEINQAMDFRKMPVVKWKRSSLRDEKAVQQFKLALFDRGVLSGEALIREADEDMSIEVARQKNEKKIADDTGIGVFDKRGPYYRPEDQAKLGIMPYGWSVDKEEHPIKTENDSGEQPENIPNPNGRPPGKEDENERKTREPKPRGIDVANVARFRELTDKASTLLAGVEAYVKKYSKRINGKSLEHSVYCYVSHIDPKSKKEDMKRVIGEKKEILEPIEASFKQIRDYFKLKSPDNKLNKSVRYNLFAWAWAMHYI